jgi:RNA polymerase sigma-19 factor, ECF subfamily
MMTREETKILIKQFKSGDKNAINVLYNVYSSKLYRFAFSYLKSEEDAKDVVQEVFINIWEKRSTLKEDTRFDSFLFTITKNSIISTFRKKISEKDYLNHLKGVVIKNAFDTAAQVDYDMLTEQVGEVVKQLPPVRKQVYTLSRESGMSNKEIAARLNISQKTVEDHMTKALRFIREHMKEFGVFAVLFFELFVQ